MAKIDIERAEFDRLFWIEWEKIKDDQEAAFIKFERFKAKYNIVKSLP